VSVVNINEPLLPYNVLTRQTIGFSIISLLSTVW